MFSFEKKPWSAEPHGDRISVFSSALSSKVQATKAGTIWVRLNVEEV